MPSFSLYGRNVWDLDALLATKTKRPVFYDSGFPRKARVITFLEFFLGNCCSVLLNVCIQQHCEQPHFMILFLLWVGLSLSLIHSYGVQLT